MLDDGQLPTENVAILYWVAERAPAGKLRRIRLIEMLAFIATELHKPFVRVIFPTSDAEREVARKMITERFDSLAERLAGPTCSAANAAPPTPICTWCCAGRA